MKKKIFIALITIILVGSVIFAWFFFRGTKYTIKFDTDGGSKVQSIEVEKGKTVKLPETTKEGFIFDGWYEGTNKVDNNTTFDKDTTLKANWIRENTFKVTFDSNGGSKVEDLYVECGDVLKLPANPTKEGFTFGHWEDKNEMPILDQALLTCHDVTLYAKWNEEPNGAPLKEPETFKVTFDSRGGSNVPDLYVACGDVLRYPANPTKEGFTFGHWEDKNGVAILDQALLTCHDVTLYAVWR